MKCDKRLTANLLAEFCGSAIFMSVGCMGDTFSANNNLAKGIAFGCAMVIVYQCFQYSSGGHANPCVTCAAIILEKVEVVEGLLYMVMQILGTFFGFAVAFGVRPSGMILFTQKECFCCNILKNGISIGGAFALELISTVAYIFAWCALFDKRNDSKQDSMSLRLGLCLSTTIISACVYASGCANMLRPLPPAIFSNQYDDIWIFVTAPIAPAILVPFLWKYVFAEPDENEKS